MKNVARPSSGRQNGYTLGEAFWRGRVHFAAFSYVLWFSILRVSSSDGTVSRAFHHGFKRPKTGHVFQSTMRNRCQFSLRREEIWKVSEVLRSSGQKHARIKRFFSRSSCTCWVQKCVLTSRFRQRSKVPGTTGQRFSTRCLRSFEIDAKMQCEILPPRIVRYWR